jgi:hypothetical protein
LLAVSSKDITLKWINYKVTEVIEIINVPRVDKITR